MDGNTFLKTRNVSLPIHISDNMCACSKKKICITLLILKKNGVDFVSQTGVTRCMMLYLQIIWGIIIILVRGK